MARASQSEVQRRQKAVWDLKLQGKPVVEIAAITGLSERTVYNHLNRAVTEVDVTAMLEQEVAVDLGRIEALINAFWPSAIGKSEDGANLDHAHFVLKALDRKAKLLGLDAPKRIDVYGIIEQWAMKEGLDPTAVIEVVGTLLPEPKAPLA